MSSLYFGGCEGGASHSKMIIVNEKGEIVTEAVGEGTNNWLIGMDECVRRIKIMVDTCKQQIGLAQPLHCLGLSLSGADDLEKQTAISDLLLQTYPDTSTKCFTCNDSLSPLVTATSGGGVVLIAGTGSNCLLANQNGQTTNCGGWGHFIGDKGSAHWIVLKALKIIYEDHDGLNRSLFNTGFLKQEMFNYFSMKDFYGILPHLYPKDAKAIDKLFIARFCLEGVVKGALLGDKLCLHLFYLAGRQLGRHVKALVPRMDAELLNADGGLKVICVGSVWKSWQFLQTGFLEGIHPQTDEEKQLKQFVLIALKAEGRASLGAASWAAHKANLHLPVDYQRMSTPFFSHRF